MKRIVTVLLVILLFVGCASIPSHRVVLTESEPTGSITTAANVKPDGAFHKVVKTGNSKRTLSGTLTEAENGFLDLQLNYENRHQEDGDSSVSSTNTQVKIYPNTEMPFGGLTSNSHSKILTVRVKIDEPSNK